jgi:pre-rRNA-processing protein TSR2
MDKPTARQGRASSQHRHGIRIQRTRSIRRPSSNGQKIELTMSEAQMALFARGVLASLAMWPALHIALQLRLVAYESAEEITQRLALELIDAFISAGTSMPDPSRLEDFLKEFVEVELEVLLEDDSERSVTADLCRLWRTCTVSPEAEARQTVEHLEGVVAAKRPMQVSRLAGVNDGNTSDEDSDGSEEGDDHMEVDDAPPAPASFKPAPVIDEDGFETVVRRKR